MGDLMKKTLKYWQIGGFVYTAIMGVMLHFLYDWTNQSIIFGLFSAINESIGEHLKLLFFPMFTFALIEYKLIGNNFKYFWGVKLAGTVTGLLLIPAIYYFYTGIFGVNADWFNIIIFFIVSGISYVLEYLMLNNNIKLCNSSIIPFIILCLIMLTFFVMTFVHPEIPFFQDMTNLSKQQ